MANSLTLDLSLRSDRVSWKYTRIVVRALVLKIIWGELRLLSSVYWTLHLDLGVSGSQ